MTIIRGVKYRNDRIIEPTIKTAAPCGALLAFCDYVSVDAMSGIQYDDRGLRGRCSYGIIKKQSIIKYNNAQLL